MTNFLEPQHPLWKPPARYLPQDNQEAWNNDGRELVTEDFEDSPFRE